MIPTIASLPPLLLLLCLQVLLDKSTPFMLYRWLALGALLLVYALRVFLLKG